MTNTKTMTIEKDIQWAVDDAIAAWEEGRPDGLSFHDAIAEQVLDPGDASDLVHAAIESVIVPLGFAWDTGHGGGVHRDHTSAPVVVAFEWESLTVEVRVSDIFRRDPVGAFFERLNDDELWEVLEGFSADLTDVFEADGYVFKEC